mmetsp:Transcript_25772/g.102911  ORF Transcript_25772/g.102911 Transcript_25772/m.102911 type:complete len:459 (-) Transcript_25772:156-1532(-)
MGDDSSAAWRCDACADGVAPDDHATRECVLCGRDVGRNGWRFVARRTTKRGLYAHHACAEHTPGIPIAPPPTAQHRGSSRDTTTPVVSSRQSSVIRLARTASRARPLPWLSSRSKFRCDVCGLTAGVAVTCRSPRCKHAAHVTCAFASAEQGGPTAWDVRKRTLACPRCANTHADDAAPSTTTKQRKTTTTTKAPAGRRRGHRRRDHEEGSSDDDASTARSTAKRKAAIEQRTLGATPRADARKRRRVTPRFLAGRTGGAEPPSVAPVADPAAAAEDAPVKEEEPALIFRASEEPGPSAAACSAARPTTDPCSRVDPMVFDEDAEVDDQTDVDDDGGRRAGLGPSSQRGDEPSTRVRASDAEHQVHNTPPASVPDAVVASAVPPPDMTPEGDHRDAANADADVGAAAAPTPQQSAATDAEGGATSTTPGVLADALEPPATVVASPGPGLATSPKVVSL